jgi:hypothetical protein
LVIGFLRFVGLVNAAIWIGASVFGAFAVLPAFFSPEMTAVISPPYNGFAAQVVLHRYLCMQYACAAVAVLRLIAEFLYLGRPVDRLVAALLAVIIGFGLLEGLYLEPRLKTLFQAKYHPGSTPAQREEAGRLFGPLHGLSQGVNLLVITCVGFYFWRVTRPVGGPRAGAHFPKFGP